MSSKLILRLTRGATIVALAALGAGCAMVTGKHQPLHQVSLSDIKLPEASVQERANWPKNGWWKQYHDAQLDALIEQAFAGSPNLQVLATRVESAQVMADGIKKLNYPTGGIRAVPRGETFSENYIYPYPMAGQWMYSANIAASLSWNLDLWGRNRALYRAAMGKNAAAELEYEAARQSIAANIVGLHAQLGSMVVRLRLIDGQIALQKTNKARWSEREKAGLQPVNVSLQADSVIAQLEQLRSAFIAERDILNAQLAALIGTIPNKMPSIAAPTHWTALSLPNEVPANILGSRPDIAAARHYITAATEKIKATKTEFYPDINLNVAAGLQAIGLSKIFQAGSRFDYVEPAITLPIFSTASLNAKLQNDQASLDGAIAEYNKTVYQAVSDATQQLASYRNSNAQIEQQKRLVGNNERLAGLAQSRYAQGINNQMDSLVAQINLLSSEDRLESDYAARRMQEAKLAVSLGTGFEHLWSDESSKQAAK